MFRLLPSTYQCHFLLDRILIHHHLCLTLNLGLFLVGIKGATECGHGFDLEKSTVVIVVANDAPPATSDYALASPDVRRALA
jgi:hypothetical protein